MRFSDRNFTQEFRDELCREVIDTSQPIVDVADAYGVGTETLRVWIGKENQAVLQRPVELTGI